MKAIVEHLVKREKTNLIQVEAKDLKLWFCLNTVKNLWNLNDAEKIVLSSWIVCFSWSIGKHIEKYAPRDQIGQIEDGIRHGYDDKHCGCLWILFHMSIVNSEEQDLLSYLFGARAHRQLTIERAYIDWLESKTKLGDRECFFARLTLHTRRLSLLSVEVDHGEATLGRVHLNLFVFGWVVFLIVILI